MTLSHFAGIGIISDLPLPVTFDDGWKIVWELKFQLNTRSGYDELNRYQKHLQNAIGKIKLTEFTPFLLEQLKIELIKKGLKGQTVAHILGIIRQVFSSLIHLQLFHGSNPYAGIKLPKKDNQRHRFLTKEEATMLLDALKLRSKQVWQISLLALSTGLRAGEIFHLRGENINLEERTIRILDPKSRRNRTAYLPNAALEMLRDCSLRYGKYVFPDSKGQPRQAVSKTYYRVVEELGLNDGLRDTRDKVVFHTLRQSICQA